MPRKCKNEQKLEVYSSELKTSYLRSVIAEKIMHGEDKNTIVDWLMTEYGMQFKAAVSAHRQGYVFLFLYSEQTKEDVKNMSMARLEQLYQRAELDGMLKGKDYYTTQMKNIDLVNKTAGLYDKESGNDTNTDINFNLNIGSPKPEESDEKNDDEE